MTANNLWELADNPQIDDFVQLLTEDWTDEQIERSRDRIAKIYDSTIIHRQWQDEVVALANSLQIDAATLLNDRGECMRKLSQHYPRAMMGRVYSALATRL